MQPGVETTEVGLQHAAHDPDLLLASPDEAILYWDSLAKNTAAVLWYVAFLRHPAQFGPRVMKLILLSRDVLALTFRITIQLDPLI